MLEENGYCVKLVEVIDNNCIDREVHLFKPNIAIIEALFVVPEKFAVLTKLHPEVNWVVRIHSEGAFLSQEGIAIDWISQYATFPKVFVAVNSIEAFNEVMSFWTLKGNRISRLYYLPTFYPVPKKPYFEHRFKGDVINVCCMGAIRVLKNTLIQAMAALLFVETNDLQLRFHINATVTDSYGNAPYRNTVDLFKDTKHQLVQHDWMSHEDFIKFMEGIDLGLQVSLSETFSIVAADMVSSGVPSVGSNAIRWLDEKSQAETNSVVRIAEQMSVALKNKSLPKKNLELLREDAEKSEHEWLRVMRELCDLC